jgi:hypothetical protein
LKFLINFKKINTKLNKFENLPINLILLKDKIPLFNNNFKKLSNLKQLFFFSLTYNFNNKNNSTKTIDLKKKFVLNLKLFRYNINKVLNLCQFKKKKNYKSFLIYYLIFKKFFFFLEISIMHILLKSKFIFNYSDYIYLKKKNYLFLNRSSLSLTKQPIFINKNDLIELIFNKYYVFYLIKLNNLFFKLFYKNNNLFLDMANKKKNITKIFFFFNLFNNSYIFETCYKTNTIFMINKLLSIKHNSNYLSNLLNFYFFQNYI